MTLNEDFNVDIRNIQKKNTVDGVGKVLKVILNLEAPDVRDSRMKYNTHEMSRSSEERLISIF